MRNGVNCYSSLSPPSSFVLFNLTLTFNTSCCGTKKSLRNNQKNQKDWLDERGKKDWRRIREITGDKSKVTLIVDTNNAVTDVCTAGHVAAKERGATLTQ